MNAKQLIFPALIAMAAAASAGACGAVLDPLPCADENLCYGEDIVPRLERDCARCHSQGQDGIRIIGAESDYAEIMRYVIAADAEQSELLDWAAGKGKHPVNWSPGGFDYECAGHWIDEGAVRECAEPETPDAGTLDAGD